MSISRSEVAEALRKIARGELSVSSADALGYGSTICISAGGWEIWIFDDAGELDYVEAATAPDGRKGSYDEWASGEDAEGWKDPLDMLTLDEHAGLYRIVDPNNKYSWRGYLRSLGWTDRSE